jgi:hypothetical protein
LNADRTNIDNPNLYTDDGRVLGCLRRATEFGSVFPAWASDQYERVPAVPRSEWKTQAGLEWAEYSDVNQASDPACCLASLANSAQFHLAICGRDRIELDWRRAWLDLSGGRGGVALDHALEYVTTKGYPIKGSTERLFAEEVWDAESPEDFLSGIYRGCRGIYGRFIGRGGHAEFPAYIKMVSGKAVMRVRGTWGQSYGEQGWYDVPESDLVRGVPAFGAFLVREWTIRPADATNFPDAKG